MRSGLVDPVDLVLSITALVLLWLKGEGGSARGLILLYVLSVSLSERWFWNGDLGE